MRIYAKKEREKRNLCQRLSLNLQVSTANVCVHLSDAKHFKQLYERSEGIVALRAIELFERECRQEVNDEFKA